MVSTVLPGSAATSRGVIAGIFAVCASLLMTELALTRIFSVTMYYHFAFLAISIALFGLSASSVAVYVLRAPLARWETRHLLAVLALLHAVATVVALFALVRLRVGLNYSPANVALMLAIYALAALPFFTGGAVVALAFARLARQINTLYAADLLGAAAGCVALIPLLNSLGAPGGVLTAATLSALGAIAFAASGRRVRMTTAAVLVVAIPLAAQLSGSRPFDVTSTKGHEHDTVLFSKWNSFSRVAVYDRAHGDWSLSPTYSGRPGASLFMDIDSAASTPILKDATSPDATAYLRYELTALAYHLVEGRPGGFSALVIGPGGGRDLASALAFGAGHVDGVEINPIIANDIMLGRFRDYSGGIYAHPKVATHVADGRNFHVIDEIAAARTGDRIEARVPDIGAAGELDDYYTMAVVSRILPDDAKFVVIEVALKNDEPFLQLLTIHVVARRSPGRAEVHRHRLDVLRADGVEELLDRRGGCGATGEVGDWGTGRWSGRRRTYRTGRCGRGGCGTRACGEQKERKQGLLHTILHESWGEPTGRRTCQQDISASM